MSRAIFGTSRVPGPLRVQKDSSQVQATVTSKTGNEPKKDGEVNVYLTQPFHWNLLVENAGSIVRRVGSRVARKSSAPVLFVNGIKGTPKKHRQQALMTSAFSGGPVEGVFNQSDGVIKDLVQCLHDKRTSVEFMSQVRGWVDNFKDVVGLGGEESTVQSRVEESISDNLATLALFRKLLEPSYRNATVVAHSQGNIITSNAFNAVAALRGKDAIANMRVISIGSPVTFWSNMKNVHSFGFKNDGVTIPSFSRGEHSAYAGLAAVEDTHGTEEPIWFERSSRIDQKLTHTYFLYVMRYWDELVSLFP